jgi:hypothetical protein
VSGREEFLLLRGDASPEERAAILAVLERRDRAMRLAAWRRTRQAAIMQSSAAWRDRELHDPGGGAF